MARTLQTLGLPGLFLWTAVGPFAWLLLALADEPVPSTPVSDLVPVTSLADELELRIGRPDEGPAVGVQVGEDGALRLAGDEGPVILRREERP